MTQGGKFVYQAQLKVQDKLLMFLSVSLNKTTRRQGIKLSETVIPRRAARGIRISLALGSPGSAELQWVDLVSLALPRWDDLARISQDSSRWDDLARLVGL